MKVLKVLLLVLLLIAVATTIAVVLFQKSIQAQTASDIEDLQTFTATRLLDTPIVHPAMHPLLETEAQEYGYTNINGPSLIRVPDWIEQPLGQYYLYFAHHKGRFLRLAYADSLQGPWTMHEEEILPLAMSGTSTVASPALEIRQLKKYLNWSQLIALSTVGEEAKKHGKNAISSK